MQVVWPDSLACHALHITRSPIMKSINTLAAGLGLMSALALGGCATSNSPPDSPNYGPNYGPGNPNNNYSERGVVHSVEFVRKDSSGIGLGTLAGAVVGGAVGNQLGAGKGNTAATVVGVAGGAYLGHELESRHQQNEGDYKITVRMADGSYKTLMQNTNTKYSVGDRVRIHNGVMQHD